MNDFYEKYFVAPDGCWIWLGAVTKNGYGTVYFEKTTQMAHRVLYKLNIGTIPDGMQIDHLCRNVSCVNPHHLEAVTAQENNKRRPYAKNCKHGVGKTMCRNGCREEYSKSYYVKNKEKLLKKQNDYYAENREIRLAYQNDYYAKSKNK